MVHLKRLSSPKFWKLRKKERKWAVTPRAGPHRKFESIPLLVLIRDILKIIDSGSDGRHTIKSGNILIDGVPRKDHKYPVGIMDVVSIPKLKANYRVVPTAKGPGLIEIDADESKKKLCRINEKNILKGGIVQLNCHDGRNILIDVKNPKKPAEDVYSTGDSLLIEVPSQKVAKHLKMDSGMRAIIIAGQNKGDIVSVNKIVEVRGREPNKALCEREGKKLEANKDYVFVVGEKNPVIKIRGEVI